MEFKIYFSTRERLGQALKALYQNPKYSCLAYGRDWSEPNIYCPTSPMFYVEFKRIY